MPEFYWICRACDANWPAVLVGLLRRFAAAERVQPAGATAPARVADSAAGRRPR